MKIVYTGQNKAREYDGVDKPTYLDFETEESKGTYIVDIAKYDAAVIAYNAHIATLQEYPVIGEHSWQEGKVYEEGVDFELKCDNLHMGRCYGMLCKCEGPYLIRPFEPKKQEKCNGNCGMSYCDEYGCIDNKPEGDYSHLLTKPNQEEKQKAGGAWREYIKQFQKLDEFWQSIPEVTNTWLSQQIDIFAGKYGEQEEKQGDGKAKKKTYNEIWHEGVMFGVEQFRQQLSSAQATIAEQAKEIERLNDKICQLYDKELIQFATTVSLRSLQSGEDGDKMDFGNKQEEKQIEQPWTHRFNSEQDFLNFLKLERNLAAAEAIIEKQKAELEDLKNRLEADIANIKTVMIAAAEEIDAHWAAHCDGEGWGPSSLLHLLQHGIPTEYGYTAGAFKRLSEENEKLNSILEERDAEIADLKTVIVDLSLKYYIHIGKDRESNEKEQFKNPFALGGDLNTQGAPTSFPPSVGQEGINQHYTGNIKNEKEAGDGEEDWKVGDRFTTPETGDQEFTVIEVSKRCVEARDRRSRTGITCFETSYITRKVD